jgi:hypothetical protein
MDKILTNYESFALTEYLSYFPEDKPYKVIIKMLIDGDLEVMPWELFEGVDRKGIASIIESLRQGLEDAFVPRGEDK